MGTKRPSSRHSRSLSRDEAYLWRLAVADVTPIVRPVAETVVEAVADTTAEALAAAGLPGLSALAAPDAAGARPLESKPVPRLGKAAPRLGSGSGGASAPAELVAGAASGIDKRTLARLRRGLIAPDARVDLHNRTQEEAHHLLAAVLASSHTAGRRCVLVITGKGYGPGGAVGVLKTMVPRWLNEQPNRSRVLAFCHAPATQGGEGALYVLLRRLKAAAPR